MRAVHRRFREDRRRSFRVDFPDEILGGVRDEGVALEVGRHGVGDRAAGGGGGGGGGERGEEDAFAGPEVVGGEGVEFREGIGGVDGSEEAFVDGIDGEAENRDVFREIRIVD